MAIQWDQSLSVGIDEIDNQHKELFSRVNALLDACNQGKGKQVVGEIIDFLGDYVVTHFGAEERYMQQYGYPDYDAHKAMHDGFIDSFSELKKKFESEGPGIQLVLLTNRTVVDWLINHIGNTDKALGGFLKTKM
ncbi:bacteriohemerythrin [Mahella australiensis]|uniref:Hemerythrin-like metal-binding protein n=1 Tax=Mahella australiensis (strain DSM 15567 / CIP 107919 / 50-1 BON) TaxID=697281 RepID=F4A317_MAHA5|nr:bacteriohemerythrin [Mahella australiensis]AEE95232.1 hemerythrin-like metal-binding protein [Mahella australiensis 50-1 BON]